MVHTHGVSRDSFQEVLCWCMLGPNPRRILKTPYVKSYKILSCGVLSVCTWIKQKGDQRQAYHWLTAKSTVSHLCERAKGALISQMPHISSGLISCSVLYRTIISHSQLCLNLELKIRNQVMHRHAWEKSDKYIPSKSRQDTYNIFLLESQKIYL